MGILKTLHEPYHLKTRDGRLASLAPPLMPSCYATTKKKRVSFNANVRVQILERDNGSVGGCSDDDSWYHSITDKSIPSRRVSMPKRKRRRKPKIPVQRVLLQQAKELRSTGHVNPYSLADVSIMISSIFAQEAHVAALHCAVEVDEYYLQQSGDSRNESEVSDFEDILLQSSMANLVD